MFRQSSPCVNLEPALCLNACAGSYVALHLRLGLGHRTLLTKCGPQCLQATRNVRIALGTFGGDFPLGRLVDRRLYVPLDNSLTCILFEPFSVYWPRLHFICHRPKILFKSDASHERRAHHIANLRASTPGELIHKIPPFSGAGLQKARSIGIKPHIVYWMFWSS